MRKLWGDDEKYFVMSNWQTMSIDDIANKLNRSYNSVYRWCYKNNITNTISNSRFEINFDFFTNMSIDLAYFLGFVMSDGYVSKSSIEFKIHPKDDEILKHFQSLIYNDNKNRIVYENRFDKSLGGYFKKARLRIHSCKICKIMNECHGFQFGSKTGSEFIPKSITDEFYPDFIRGVFDGDGGAYRYDKNNNLYYRAMICCANKEFLENIKLYCGVGSITKNKIYNWTCNGQNTVVLRNIMYNNLESFALKRKKDILMEIDDKRKYAGLLNDIQKRYLQDNLNQDNYKIIAKDLNISEKDVKRIGRSKGLIK